MQKKYLVGLLISCFSLKSVLIKICSLWSLLNKLCLWRGYIFADFVSSFFRRTGVLITSLLLSPINGFSGVSWFEPFECYHSERARYFLSQSFHINLATHLPLRIYARYNLRICWTKTEDFAAHNMIHILQARSKRINNVALGSVNLGPG
jgi:hypothetical protein